MTPLRLFHGQRHDSMICRPKRPLKEPEGTISKTDIWRAAEPDARGRLLLLRRRFARSSHRLYERDELVERLPPTVAETHVRVLLGALFVAMDCDRRVFCAG